MVSWGLISAAMMFAHTATAFYVLRFLLGVAEAGFFPGVILYLTYWFPSRYRARALGFFYFGAPLAFIFGSPLSGLLLEFDGLGGLRGWQWMFLVEGVLASLVGVWAWFYLDNRPRDARWLSDAEKQALQQALDAEDAAKPHQGGLLRLLGQPRILLLCSIYLLIQASVYGVVFAAMNAAWERWIAPGTAPARCTVEGCIASPHLLIEISVIAATSAPIHP